MENYETVFIARPDLKDEEIKNLIQNFVDLIITNGEIEKTEELGRKKLAYEVKGHKEGIYVVIYFKSKPEFITELERVYKITEAILKFIVVKVDE